MDDITISWRDKAIGTITNLEIDIWYCNCQWHPDESPAAAEFRELVSGFNTQEILNTPELGTRIILKDPGTNEETNALVISLEDQSLFIRYIYDRIAVNWLVKNVH
jgi:hypothetical protein